MTDQDITDFVNSVKAVSFLCMYSKAGYSDTATIIQNLATLRPELILPKIIDRMYESLETLTEPHKLTASIHAMFSVSRTMVGGSFYFTRQNYFIT